MCILPHLLIISLLPYFLSLVKLYPDNVNILFLYVGIRGICVNKEKAISVSKFSRFIDNEIFE